MNPATSKRSVKKPPPKRSTTQNALSQKRTATALSVNPTPTWISVSKLPMPTRRRFRVKTRRRPKFHSPTLRGVKSKPTPCAVRQRLRRSPPPTPCRNPTPLSRLLNPPVLKKKRQRWKQTSSFSLKSTGRKSKLKRRPKPNAPKSVRRVKRKRCTPRWKPKHAALKCS